MTPATKSKGTQLVELRRSNAAGKHQDRRTKRLRARGARNRDGIKNGW